MKASPAVANLRIADRLLSEGKLSSEGHADATQYVGIHGGRVEDAIIESRIMSELDLLRAVSTIHGTRFISTEKLYKAQLDPQLIRLVPRKLAEQHGVLPVIYDDKRVLTVVTADPDNLMALQEVRSASGVRDVVPLLARPAAVLAAIQRAYQNDPSLFASLMRADAGPAPMQFQTQVSRFNTGSSTGNSPFATGVASAMTVTRPQSDPFGPVVPPPPPRPAPAAASPAVQTGVHTAPVPGHRFPSAPPAAPMRHQSARPPAPGGNAAAAAPPAPALTTDYVETLNVLVSLLDNARPDLRGHSALCARLVKRVCDRMGLGQVQTAALVVAAYLHDIGKAGTYHLTALNVAEYDGHRAAAQKVSTAPERFLAAVALHLDTKTAVASMYERFDGTGFPAGIGQTAIPLGARLLAVVDTYSDLTTNPRNPARRVLNPVEAMAFIGNHRGTVFDPTVVDILRSEVAGEEMRNKILADRCTVLLVDPDPEETMVLELRLLEAGYDVRIARTMQQAMHELQSREIAVVVSEVDLDIPDAGLTIRSSSMSQPWGQRVMVWVMHTRKNDRQIAEIVFDLGVDDLISKPSSPDVFVTKLKQLIDRKEKQRGATSAPKGVNGSLAEMGLPDVVQVLWHGRKSCTVRIKSLKGQGDIGFLEGQIVDANFSFIPPRPPPNGPKHGEDAFYAMLMLTTGDFQIDPTTQPTARTIENSPEGLLLEGMRRMDEGLGG